MIKNMKIVEINTLTDRKDPTILNRYEGDQFPDPNVMNIKILGATKANEKKLKAFGRSIKTMGSLWSIGKTWKHLYGN